MAAHPTPVGTIVIVTYNCRDYIIDCLASLVDRGPAWEVVVADNGSRDGTIEVIRSRFPWARVVELGSNKGFGPANNAGAQLSSTPWLFFLNPDTVVTRGALDAMLDSAARTGAGVIAPRLNGLNGLYQAESAELRLPTFTQLSVELFLLHRLWPSGPTRRELANFDPSQPRQVEQPIAAALLVKRAIFESIGGFDERFRPIWFEDVDLCKRLREAGLEIWYRPEAVIVHVRQHSLGLYTPTAVRAMLNANMIRYVRKHFPPWQAAALRGIAVAGTLLRASIRGIHPRHRAAAAGHFGLAWKMIRFSDESRWYA